MDAQYSTGLFFRRDCTHLKNVSDTLLLQRMQTFLLAWIHGVGMGIGGIASGRRIVGGGCH